MSTIQQLKQRSIAEKDKMLRKRRVRNILLEREIERIEECTLEKEFKEALEKTKAVLKDTYVNNIIYIQERMKDNADEKELKNIEELIIANERMIVYYDEGDDWVKQLHEDAQSGADNGTGDGLGDDSGDDEGEVARIEEARNS